MLLLYSMKNQYSTSKPPSRVLVPSNLGNCGIAFVSHRHTTMKTGICAAMVLLAPSALAFSPRLSAVPSTRRLSSSVASAHNKDLPLEQQQQQQQPVAEVSRREVAGLLGAAFLAASGVVAPEPAEARGRSTQVASWSRYGARIQQFRSWLAGDLKAIIASADYEALKAATAPKKSILTSYLGAMDLWASSYSDASPSQKTLRMLDDVVKLRQAQAELNVLALKATGEGLKTTGGLFGMGGKKEEVPSPAEMKKLLDAVKVAAIEAYNDYAVVNNEGHPFEVDELLEIGV